MRDAPGNLFARGDLFAVLNGHADKMSAEVNAISADQMRATPDQDLIEFVAAKLRIPPLEIYDDRAEMEQFESKIDVRGDLRRRSWSSDDGQPVYVPALEIRISIPYTGEPSLWTFKPSSWRSMRPWGLAYPPNRGVAGSVILVVLKPSDELDAKAIEAEVRAARENLKFYVDVSHRQVSEFNASLPQRIETLVKARKERLALQSGIAQSLGIPLKRRDGVPSVESIKLPRSIVRPLPPVPHSGFKPEPGISTEDYEHILKVIRHETRTFENAPGTFAKLDEEQLRDIVLAHLNGHYHGAATGETFRRSGKTDIRIEAENRAAFVGECKVWRGPKELHEAIDQLLGRYLTWRDSKAALVIFNNQNARFTEVQAKVPEAIRAHPRFRRDLQISPPEEGEWRFMMTSAEDEGRQVTVHVFAVNLFVAD